MSVNTHLLRRGSATWTVPPHSCHGNHLSGAALLSFVDASNRRRAAGCACNSGRLCANCCLVLPEGPPAALGNWWRDENEQEIKAVRRKKWQPLLHNVLYVSWLNFTILQQFCECNHWAITKITFSTPWRILLISFLRQWLLLASKTVHSSGVLRLAQLSVD